MSVKGRPAKTWSMSVKDRTARTCSINVCEGQNSQDLVNVCERKDKQTVGSAAPAISAHKAVSARSETQKRRSVCVLQSTSTPTPQPPYDRQEWGRGWGRMHAGRHGNGTPLCPEPSGLAEEPGGVQCSRSPPAPWCRHPIRNAAADCGRTPSVWKGSE